MDTEMNMKYEQLKADMQRLRGDMPSLLETVKGRSADYLDSTSAAAAAKMREARQVAKQAGHDIDEFGHEKPWAVAGLAAVVGLLVGSALFSRRRD